MFANLELEDKIWDKVIREFDENQDGRVSYIFYYLGFRFPLMNLKK